MTLHTPKIRVAFEMRANFLVAFSFCLILPMPSSSMEEILSVTGPGREAPVMEDSDKGTARYDVRG